MQVRPKVSVSNGRLQLSLDMSPLVEVPDTTVADRMIEALREGANVVSTNALYIVGRWRAATGQNGRSGGDYSSQTASPLTQLQPDEVVELVEEEGQAENGDAVVDGLEHTVGASVGYEGASLGVSQEVFLRHPFHQQGVVPQG
ncbi:hypothetical protein EYF80_050750 [Liparis tanakae]|uniref:Uncharacterized protein n=1 Tax=Liparis tanakae TaxID=230148 RepID=A0A4Z2FDM5_9TELE|nr:hypothetical protein EYF80_050750 [Liparis tanakae]